jgi:hypothetical protein
VRKGQRSVSTPTLFEGSFARLCKRPLIRGEVNRFFSPPLLFSQNCVLNLVQQALVCLVPVVLPARVLACLRGFFGRRLRPLSLNVIRRRLRWGARRYLFGLRRVFLAPRRGFFNPSASRVPLVRQHFVRNLQANAPYSNRNSETSVRPSPCPLGSITANRDPRLLPTRYPVCNRTSVGITAGFLSVGACVG